ncbi:MAG: hypothetical protein PVJ86_13955 [Phycisphaerales bacterium]|jgi:hypothetical protein
MIKIDKIELFRVFVILEATLVGLPIIIFGSVGAVLCVVGYSILGWLGACFALEALPCIFGVYFLLPGLVAPRLFQATVPGASPKGIAGWLVVVGVYSVLALLISLPVSMRMSSRGRDRLSAEHLAAPAGGEAPQTDQTKGADKGDGATSR